MPIKKKISSPSRRSVSSRKSASVSGSVRKRKKWSLKDLFLIFGLILILPVVIYAAKQTIQTRQKAAGTNINKIVNGDFESGGRDVRAWSQSCGAVAGAATVLGDATPDYTQHGTCGDARRVYGCFTPDIEQGTNIPRCPGWPASGYNQRVPNSLSPAYPPVTNCAPQYVCCTVGTPPTPPSPVTCTVTRSPTGDVTVNQRVSLSASCTGGSGTFTRYNWSLSRIGSGTGTGAIYEKNGDADSQVQFASETPGSFNVGLIVTDSRGSFGTVNVPIAVTEQAPPPGQLTCTLSAAQASVSVNTVDRVSAACSGGSGTYTYRWTKSGGAFQAGGTNTSTTADFVSETPGSYNVSLMVTDSQGHSVSNNVVIQVTATSAGNKPDYIPFVGSIGAGTSVRYENGMALGPNGDKFNIAFQNVGDVAGTTGVKIRMVAFDGTGGGGTEGINQWFTNHYNANPTMRGEYVLQTGLAKNEKKEITNITIPTAILTRFTTGSRGTVCLQLDSDNTTAEKVEENNVACKAIPSCSVGMLGNNWNPMGITKFSPTPVVQYSLVQGPAGRTVPNISTPKTAQKVEVLAGSQKGIQRYITGVTSGDIVSVQIYVVSGAVTVEWGRGDDAEHWIDRVTQTNQWKYLPHYVSASDAAPNFLMIYADARAEFYVDDVQANSIGQIDLVPSDVRANAQLGRDMSLSFDILNQELVKEQNQSFTVRAFFDANDTVFKEQNMVQKIRLFNQKYYVTDQAHKREISLNNVLIPSSDEGGYVKNDQVVQFSRAYPEGFDKTLYFCVYVNSGSSLTEKNTENNISCIKYDSRPDLVGFTGTANGYQYRNGIAPDLNNKRLVHYGITNSGGLSSGGTSVRLVVVTAATVGGDPLPIARDYFASFDTLPQHKAFSSVNRTINVGEVAYNDVGFDINLESGSPLSYVCMQIDGPNAVAEANEANNISCERLPRAP